jgi:hypothetical protein
MRPPGPDQPEHTRNRGGARARLGHDIRVGAERQPPSRRALLSIGGSTGCSPR